MNARTEKIRFDAFGGRDVIARNSADFQRIDTALFAAYPLEKCQRRLLCVQYERRELTCYANVDLIRVSAQRESENPLEGFALIGSDFVQYLSGNVQDIYGANLMTPCLLEDDTQGSRPAEWCNSVIPERVSIRGH